MIRAIANGVVVGVVAAVVVPVSLRSSHLPMDAEVVLPLPRPRGAAISICAAMATDVVVVVVDDDDPKASQSQWVEQPVDRLRNPHGPNCSRTFPPDVQFPFF